MERPPPATATQTRWKRTGKTLRNFREKAFAALLLAAVLVGVAALGLLLWDVLRDARGYLDLQFLTSFPSRLPSLAGIKSALAGSLWLMALVAVIAFPLGLGAAIYLEEFAPKNRLTALMEANIANLAGVPSIVYGILGLALFVRYLSFGRSLLAGSLTISLLVLPIVIIAAREALRGVPSEIRLAALALGATRWQAVRHQVLPAALPGILTGMILALSRAIGETAPLIMIGALTFIAFLPATPLDPFTVLPIQIFNWTSRPQEEFRNLAAAGIVVLLAVLLAINAVAIFLRNRYTRKW